MVTNFTPEKDEVDDAIKHASAKASDKNMALSDSGESIGNSLRIDKNYISNSKQRAHSDLVGKEINVFNELFEEDSLLYGLEDESLTMSTGTFTEERNFLEDLDLSQDISFEIFDNDVGILVNETHTSSSKVMPTEMDDNKKDENPGYLATAAELVQFFEDDPSLGA